MKRSPEENLIDTIRPIFINFNSVHARLSLVSFKLQIRVDILNSLLVNNIWNNLVTTLGFGGVFLFCIHVLVHNMHKTIMLPVVLCGCEAGSLTLREECRLRDFENRILRRIFGSNRDENGRWRRLHNQEFYSLCRSLNIVRVIKPRRLRWSGHVARMEEGMSIFEILKAKPTGKRPLGRSRR